MVGTLASCLTCCPAFGAEYSLTVFYSSETTRCEILWWFFSFILKTVKLKRGLVCEESIPSIWPQNSTSIPQFEKHVSVPGCTKRRWGGHCTLNPVYHRGRPAHWHWTLSHLKEGRGTAQGLSSGVRQEKKKEKRKYPRKQRHGGILILTAHNQLIRGYLSIEHEAATEKKHAKVPWKSEEYSETKAQGAQRPDYTDAIIMMKSHLASSWSALFTCFKKLWPPF